MRQLHYRATSLLFDDVFDASERPKFMNAWRQRDLTASLGLFHSDYLVGFTLAETINGTTKLHYVCVAPDYQGRGLGSRLLKATIDATVENPQSNSKTLWLNPVDDAKLLAWYKAFGFQLSSAANKASDNGLHRVLVRRRLAGC